MSKQATIPADTREEMKITKKGRQLGWDKRIKRVTHAEYTSTHYLKMTEYFYANEEGTLRHKYYSTSKKVKI